jgi:aspartate/methionine/tyrosine aminotransferase
LSAPVRSPFVRLNELLGDAPPGRPAILASVGEPQHAIPDFVGPVLQANLATLNRYPAIRGTDEFRGAVAAWAARRYPGGKLDPASEVIVLAGSREGLLSVALTAARSKRFSGRRLAPMPNPYYPPYAASAVASGLEPVLMPAAAETGFLPDLDALDSGTLDRTAMMILCSPANPQGAVASRAYLAKALTLARRHGCLLVVDECYSEIYSGEPPAGALEVAGETGSNDNLVVLNSLSKRSNLAGLRVGFAAGDAAFITELADFRNVTAAQVSLAVQAVAVAAYADEAHVAASRALYVEKFEEAERVLGNRFGPVRPAGGFFLWLDVREHGGDEAAAVRLWREGGLKVVPGTYVGAPDATGRNPGEGYLRVALVHDRATASDVLRRIAGVLA